jgi:hypothetical protein
MGNPNDDLRLVSGAVSGVGEVQRRRHFLTPFFFVAQGLYC